MMVNVPIILIILPLAAGGLALLEKSLPALKLSRPAALISFGGSLVLLAQSYPRLISSGPISYAVGGWDAVIAIHLSLDGIALIASIIIQIVGFICLLYFFKDKQYEAGFIFFFMIMIAGMEGVVQSLDIFNLFVFLEIIGIAAYILVAYLKKGPALVASLKYLILSSLAMAFYLIGVLFLYRYTGSFHLEVIGNYISLHPGLLQGGPLLFAFVFLIVGIGTRTAFIPFHTWLPDAHGYAPHPVSAILSGVMIKVAFIALWRIVFAASDPRFSSLLLWLGSISAVITVINALAQSDLKRLLAFHSVSQMGFILAAFGAASAGPSLSSSAHVAALYHSLSHAFFKALLFLTIGGVIFMSGERDYRKISGIAKRKPLLFIVFLVGALSISGVPPFNGFISKKLVFSAVKPFHLPYALLFAASVGTVASFIKLSTVFFQGKLGGKKRGETFLRAEDADPSKEVEPRVQIEGTGRKGITRLKCLSGMGSFSLLILASLCIASGLFPNFTAGQISFLIGQKAVLEKEAFYSFSSLANVGLSLGLGFMVFLFIRSNYGRRLSQLIKKAKVNFNTAMLLVLIGLSVFSAVLFFDIFPS